MSRIVALNRLRNRSLENTTSAREPIEQKSTRGGEISIVQSIQLDFLLSLGTATSNDAKKSAMRRAEWTITARRAVLRLTQMKYRYFHPEHCNQNTFFSGTSHQNRSYLCNITQFAAGGPLNCLEIYSNEEADDFISVSCQCGIYVSFVNVGYM